MGAQTDTKECYEINIARNFSEIGRWACAASAALVFTLVACADPRSTDPNRREHADVPDFSTTSLVRTTAYGSEAPFDMIRIITRTAQLYGADALLTKKVEVRNGDTLCKFYGRELGLFVTRTYCLENLVVELRAALDGEASAQLAIGERLSVPIIEDVSRRRDRFVIYPGDPVFAGIRLKRNRSANLSTLDIFGHTETFKTDTKQEFNRGDTRVLSMPGLEPVFVETGVYEMAIRVNADVSAWELRRATSNLSASVNLMVARDAELQPKARFSSGSPNLHWEKPDEQQYCAMNEQSDPPKPSSELSYYYLFEWLKAMDWEPNEHLQKCIFMERNDNDCRDAGDGNSCVDLLVLDDEIRMHDEITGVVRLDRTGDVVDRTWIDDEGLPMCTNGMEAMAAGEHGTHLTSLVASRLNGQGFVGMAPGLDIYHWPWTEENSLEALHLFMQNRYENRNNDDYTVVVFASTFTDEPEEEEPFISFPPQYYDRNFVLFNMTRDEHDMAPLLRNMQRDTMWVIPAMQLDPNIMLTWKFVHARNIAVSPQNLGDRRNIITVTACSECDGPEASIWTKALAGEKGFVHVAAPGTSVLAPVGPGEVRLADGTSQATALVAGLVGAMLNCYPNAYTVADPANILLPDVLKRRLMLTARPVFRGDDLDLVDSGVVDPQTALLDPRHDWYRGTNEKNYTRVDVTRWCGIKQLILKKTATDKQLPLLRNVLRIKHSPTPYIRGDGEPYTSDDWIVFNKLYSDLLIKRYDPRHIWGMISTDGSEIRGIDQPLLWAKIYGEDGTVVDEGTLSLNQIDDLILSGTVTESVPCIEPE